MRSPAGRGPRAEPAPAVSCARRTPFASSKRTPNASARPGPSVPGASPLLRLNSGASSPNLLRTMRSRARQERRLVREQDTVGALRAERLEQETLGANSNLEVIVTKAKRQKLEQELAQRKAEPRRTARPGKPLKR